MEVNKTIEYYQKEIIYCDRVANELLMQMEEIRKVGGKPEEVNILAKVAIRYLDQSLWYKNTITEEKVRQWKPQRVNYIEEMERIRAEEKPVRQRVSEDRNNG